MSSPRNPYHNAQAESFMKTLKVEEVYLVGYEIFDDVKTMLPRFIEEIYSVKRLHFALGHQSRRRSSGSTPNSFSGRLRVLMHPMVQPRGFTPLDLLNLDSNFQPVRT